MDHENKKTTRNFIKIAVLGNMIEAQLISSILTDRKIPHRIRSHHDTALNGLYQVQKGWGDLEAPMAFQDEINDIMNQVRAEQS